MRRDQTIAMVRAGLTGNQTEARTIALQMVATAKRAGHTGVAERIEQVIKNAAGKTGVQARGTAKGAQHLAEMSKLRTLKEMVLDDNVRITIERLIEEQKQEEKLALEGLDPRHRILLVGPPGNGKTCLAGAIADALERPLYAVRYESVIGSYLGETGARMVQIFEYVREKPCVILFDEMDAVARSRSDKQETGEMKRVVNMLLLQIDAVPAHTIVIGATNHAESIDRAAWRRFQVRIGLEAPKPKILQGYIDGLVGKREWGSDTNSKDIIEKAKPESFAEAEELAFDIAREAVLHGNGAVTNEGVETVLLAWKARNKAKPQRSRQHVCNPADSSHRAM